MRAQMALAQASARDLAREIRQTAVAANAAGNDLKAGYIAQLQRLTSAHASVTSSIRGFQNELKTTHGITERLIERFSLMPGVTLRFGEALGSLKGVLAAVGAAYAVDKLARWSLSAAEAGERIKNLATESQTSTARFSEMSQGMKLVGGDGQQLVQVARLFAQHAEEALTKPASRSADAFRALGVSAAQLKESLTDPLSLMGPVADGLDRIKRAGNDALAPLGLIGGRRIQGLLPFMEGGSAGMESRIAAARGAGGTISNDLGDKMAETETKVRLLGEAFDGLANSLYEHLQPAIDKTATALSKIITIAVEGSNKPPTELDKQAWAFDAGGIFGLLYQKFSSGAASAPAPAPPSGMDRARAIINPSGLTSGGALTGGLGERLLDPLNKLAGVDSNLVAALTEATKTLPVGWHAEVISGVRSGANLGGGEHGVGAGGAGHAIDVRLVDGSGHPIANAVGTSPGSAAYRAYQPLGDAFIKASGGTGRWGGYFGDTDIMHFGNGAGFAPGVRSGAGAGASGTGTAGGPLPPLTNSTQAIADIEKSSKAKEAEIGLWIAMAKAAGESDEKINDLEKLRVSVSMEAAQQIAAHYGDAQQQIIAAETKGVEMSAALAQRRFAIAMETAAKQRTVNQAGLAGFRADMASMAEDRQITPQQALGFDIQKVAQLRDEAISGLGTAFAAATTPDMQRHVEEQFNAIIASSDATTKELTKQWAREGKKAADAWAAPFKTAFDAIGSTFESAITGLIDRSNTLAQTWANIGKSMIGAGVSLAGSLASKGAASALGATAGEGLGGFLGDKVLSMIGLGGGSASTAAAGVSLNTAGVSLNTAAAALTAAAGALAAGGAASAAGAVGSAAGGIGSALGGVGSLVGAGLAPETGGLSMLIGPMLSFAGSAARGWAIPPSFAGGGVVNVNAHAGEHIIPQEIAQRYESGAPGGGDTHFHLHATAADGPAIERLFRSNGRVLADVIRGAFRSNALTPRTI